MEKSRLANELCTLFDKKVTAYYRQTFKGIVGQSQLEVLNYLYLNKTTTAKEISVNLNIPKQHISKILIKFEDDSLVQSIVDELDKRSKIYSLTNEGLKLMQLHIEKSDDYFNGLIDNLSPKEQEEFTNAMVVMLNLLKKL
jgi:DNA-binding MarR family transcriptional regulator